MADHTYVKYVDDDYCALYRDGQLVVETDDYYHIGDYLENELRVESHYDSTDFIDPAKSKAFGTLKEVEKNKTAQENRIMEQEREELREHKERLEEELAEVNRRMTR